MRVAVGRPNSTFAEIKRAVPEGSARSSFLFHIEDFPRAFHSAYAGSKKVRVSWTTIE